MGKPKLGFNMMKSASTLIIGSGLCIMVILYLLKSPDLHPKRLIILHEGQVTQEQIMQQAKDTEAPILLTQTNVETAGTNIETAGTNIETAGTNIETTEPKEKNSETISEKGDIPSDSVLRIPNLEEQIPQDAIKIAQMANTSNVDHTNNVNVAESVLAQSKASTIDAWLEEVNSGKRKPNVLFIVADDMRPDIKAFAHEHSPWLEPGMFTPSLDILASKALLMRRAYCQFAWCNPSRSSFLTSRRPDTTMVHNNSVYFRQNNPNFTSLPQYFKENGYLTLGMGKIFHLLNVPGDCDEPYSWSKPTLRPDHSKMVPERGTVWEAVPDNRTKYLLDEYVTEHVLNTLDSLAGQKDRPPFFFAYGLKKPHLSWVCPAKFFKYYDPNNISMPANPKAAPNLPDIAWFHSFEIRGRKEYRTETDKWKKDKPLPDWIIKEFRIAYYNCISHIDDQLGLVLKKLENTGLAENTIISFIGDHGFHLGEHSIVGKNTAFEVANNAPMMIRIPGVTDAGVVTDKLVEFVDLFPTLVELAGLPKVPYCPKNSNDSRTVNLCTEGTSLVPLFQDPANSQWKDRVFFQYPHYNGFRQDFCMGYSMRTEKYRYTEWIHYDYSKPVHADWNHLCGAELYDHYNDPNETNNVADDSNLKEVRDDLSKKLRLGWMDALPAF